MKAHSVSATGVQARTAPFNDLFLFRIYHVAIFRTKVLGSK